MFSSSPMFCINAISHIANIFEMGSSLQQLVFLTLRKKLELTNVPSE